MGFYRLIRHASILYMMAYGQFQSSVGWRYRLVISLLSNLFSHSTLDYGLHKLYRRHLSRRKVLRVEGGVVLDNPVMQSSALSLHIQ